MKLVLACPTYGAVDPRAAQSVRIAVMNAAQNGVSWQGDASPDRMGWESSRNTAAASIMDSDVDAVFWCDSDVILPPHAISSLVKHGQDFVCGIYFQRVGQHWPLINYFDKEKQCFGWYVDWTPDALMPIDGCGFGCVLTNRKLLKDMFDKYHEQQPQTPWFKFSKFSEDYEFCLRAKECGYQLYVDTSVICGHLADPEEVRYENFKEKHPEIFGEGGSYSDLHKQYFKSLIGGNGNGELREQSAPGDVGIPQTGEGPPGEAVVPAGGIQLRGV